MNEHKGKYKIEHDRENCIACGACAVIAPEFWVLSKEDGKADAVNSVKERINAMENSSMIKKYNSKDKFLVATIIGFMSYLFLGVFGFNFLEKKYSKEKEAELKNLDTG